MPSAAIPPLQVGDFTAAIVYKLNLPLIARLPGITVPDELATPSGKLYEVDVAHLGGIDQRADLPLIVTVVGTGYAGKLSSWTTSSPVGAAHLPQGWPQR